MTDVTFFMLVTPRDVVLADYAVRSYARIRDVDFELAVYSNYLLPEQKCFYFPRWQRLPFVRVIRNDEQDRDVETIKGRIGEQRLEGPFESCDTIWDRELKRIDTPLVATVDADFEVLRQRFVHAILDGLAAEPGCIAYSTDYTPTSLYYEPYSRENIVLNERNGTWFCVYRREAFALAGHVSHAYYQEILPSGPVRRNAWDSCARFQKTLRDQGYALRHLPRRYQKDYIHYGAFSKNTSVTRQNVATFRFCALAEHRLPWRASRLFRQLRLRTLPRLENNRYTWVREAPIAW
jgi:hypothetical protein